MGRFARNMMSRASGGSVALSRLWPGRTDRLIIAPHDLRTADATGVHAVFAPKDRAVGLTPVVAKVASGAADTVQYVMVTNMARALAALRERGVHVVGTAGEADDTVYQAQLAGPAALVLGAEGSGMRRLVREGCDQLVRIPMLGSVDSLNVSVAAGVCLYEALRQRGAG
ncbi:23S rRNA (guanosine-2'-O-)-methyltransferase RlmB [mine drainage metagenome]|uniref:23S rRNA (Guanosine-2'-O-)-methyltransferase RlmB n=1 Tax=mine drainage metagenome TaxID=410659 RepID=A0A1J5QZW5_9ZZZZ